MIELTHKDTGKRLLINPRNVTAVCEGGRNGVFVETVGYPMEGDSPGFTVSESYEEVKAKLSL